MHALSDEQQLEKLEKKVDDSNSHSKAEFRAVRSELGALHRSVQGMWLTMIFGFVALLLRHLV